MKLKMSMDGEWLYCKIKDMPIADRYARVDLSDCPSVFTNPWELVGDSHKRRWLSLCGRNADSMADFEAFSQWIDRVRLLPEGYLSGVFLEEAEMLFGEEFEGLGAKELWRKGCDNLAGLGFDELCERYGVREMFAPVGNKASAVSKPVFDINIALESVAKSNAHADLSRWLEGIVEQLKKAEPPYVLAADISNIRFERGDYYHSGIDFGKLCLGEKLQPSQWNSLICFLIADGISRLGEDAALCLTVGKNVGALRELLAYLSMRGLIVNTHIGMTADMAEMSKELSDMCLVDAEGRISLDVVIDITDSPDVIEKRLKGLLSVYPVERLRFGGIVGDSRMLFAAHAYARKAIAEAMAKIFPSNESALEAMEYILKSD